MPRPRLILFLIVLMGLATLFSSVTSAPTAQASAQGDAGSRMTAKGALTAARAPAKVSGSVATTCQGRVRARLVNRTPKRVVVTLRVAKRLHRVAVRAGDRRTYVVKGRAAARVVLKTKVRVLDRARVPESCSPAPTVADFPTPQSVGPATEPTRTYSGGCKVTKDDVVIEDVVVDCPETGLVMGDVEGVVIRNAVVHGGIVTSFAPTDPESEDSSHPRVFTVISSRVIGGQGSANDRAVGFAHFAVRDSYLQGSHSGLWAHNNVVIEDSYITTDGTDSHQSGLRMLKNSTLRGNTVYCKPVAGSTGNDSSGCSANAVFYREFGVPANLNIERNYFPYDRARGGGYYATRFIDCTAHDDCVGLSMTGNLFARGQGTDGREFPKYADNVWSDNWWTDGEVARSGQTR